MQPIAPATDFSEVLARASEVADKCRERATTLDVAQADAFPAQEFEWLAQAGLLTAPLPPSLGGADLGRTPDSQLALLELLKEMGRANLAVGRIYEGHINALQLIQTYGSPAQVARYAVDVVEQAKIFGVWNTEAAGGVKLFPLADGCYRLEGAKTFASGAGFIERPLITAGLPDGGWQMCVVPMEKVQAKIDPNFWQPLGMQASVSYRVDFSNIELEPTALIGTPDSYYRQPWFGSGAIRFCAVQLGGAEALFDAARAFLQATKRTDDPYQKVRLAEIAIAIESGSLWLKGAAQRLAASPFAGVEGDNEKLLAYANMTRSAIEMICLQIITLTERSVGARGLLRPWPFDRLIRDLTMYLRQPNPDGALAEVGRYVLAASDPVRKLWRDV